MRWFIAGVDGDGRSCLVAHGAQQLGANADPAIDRILVTSASEPESEPPGESPVRDVGVAPGMLEWRVVRWPRAHELPMHHTNTLDLDCVVEGSVDLILDDGAHTLVAGDCVVVPGVGHAWRTGDTGCVITIGLLGTAPRTFDLTAARHHNAVTESAT